jgi:hypothetical protein
MRSSSQQRSPGPICRRCAGTRIELAGAHTATSRPGSKHADAVGTWRGPALNRSRVEDMITTFAPDADGRLVGRYRIEDAVPFH